MRFHNEPLTMNQNNSRITSLDFIQKITDILEIPLSQEGYNVVRIQYTGVKYKTLQVMIERTDGGAITVDDCTRVTNMVSVLLDVSDIISDSYNLEISSPGLERPLIKLSDFARFVGHNVLIKTSYLIGERKRFIGRLSAVRDQIIILDNLESEKSQENLSQKTVEIPYDEIRSAHLQIDFEKRKVNNRDKN